jgi:hypothetical protein
MKIEFAIFFLILVGVGIGMMFLLRKKKRGCDSSCVGKRCDELNGCGVKCGCPQGSNCMGNGACCKPACPTGKCEGDGCGGSCKCPQGQTCIQGNCLAPHKIYGDMPYMFTEAQGKVTTIEDCANFAKQGNYRFWNYDASPQLEGKANCFVTNKQPQCASISVYGISGDVEGKLDPDSLELCKNGCVVAPEKIQGGVLLPQYQPGCGTDTGTIDIFSYEMLDSYGVNTDSCKQQNSAVPCTSSMSSGGYNFSLSGTCAKNTVTSSPAWVCQPKTRCSNAIPSEATGVCEQIA